MDQPTAALLPQSLSPARAAAVPALYASLLVRPDLHDSDRATRLCRKLRDGDAGLGGSGPRPADAPPRRSD